VDSSNTPSHTSIEYRLKDSIGLVTYIKSVEIDIRRFLDLTSWLIDIMLPCLSFFFSLLGSIVALFSKSKFSDAKKILFSLN